MSNLKEGNVKDGDEMSQVKTIFKIIYIVNHISPCRKALNRGFWKTEIVPTIKILNLVQLVL